MRAWAWSLAVVGAIAACDRFDSGEGSAAPSADAGSKDAAPPLDAGTDGASSAVLDGSAGINLAFGGDFETPGLQNCGGDGWVAYQSTASLVPTARVGQQACKFCGTGSVTGFTIDSPRREPAIAGASYDGHAWFKRVGNEVMHVRLVIRAWNGQNDDASMDSNPQAPILVPSSTDWIELTASLSLPTVVPPDFKIDAYVVVNHYEDAGAPPCAIADEIEVVRVQ